MLHRSRHGTYDCFFFFNDTATTEIYTLSLHDALPISLSVETSTNAITPDSPDTWHMTRVASALLRTASTGFSSIRCTDRKSTRLNSSHANISYAVFCLKKKKNNLNIIVSPHLLSSKSY